MIEWSEEAVLLAARPHGEDAVVAQVLTAEHGRHAGLVRGGQGRRLRGLLQPGNRLQVTWRARLSDHLGGFSVELLQADAARFLDDPARLAALSAALAILERALPEREPHPACYHGLLALIDALDGDHWGEVYVRWELAVLADLGFGLELERCAAGGDVRRLSYVSPRSGRALSEAAGEPYRDRLIPLPEFLAGRGGGGPAQIAQGLRLTGYFLERNLFHPQERNLPPARQRLSERFEAAAAKAGAGQPGEEGA